MVFGILGLNREECARTDMERQDFAPDGGESLDTFSRRCVGTVQRLAAAHAGQAIALVCHGGVLDCLYRAATGLALDAPRSWPLPNAGINRLLAGEHGLTLVGWCDTGHLADTSGAPQKKLPSQGNGSVSTNAAPRAAEAGEG